MLASVLHFLSGKPLHNHSGVDTLMWSSIFCVSFGILNWLPGYVFAHVLLILVGLFGTAWIFKLAEKKA